MVDRSVIIIGAGISGLVAGYELSKRGIPVTILEKLPIPGGLSRTESYDGYYIDSGPHLFHTANTEMISYWQEVFPDAFETPALYGKNVVDGLLFDYPLSEETIQQLPAEILEKIMGELAETDPVKLSSAKSYDEYMKVLAGPTLQEMFYKEYPEKLWGIPTTEISPNWAPQRIEIRKERKPFHADQWSAVAKDGCGSPSQILTERIRRLGGNVNFNTEVLGVDIRGERITHIRTSTNNIELGADDIVISTMPITKNAELLDLRCDLTFRNVKLVILVSIGPDPFPEDADWLYFKDPDIIFHRAGLQTRFSDRGIPKGWSIICCEIAYTSGDYISRMSERDLTERASSDLEKVGFINLSDIIKMHYMDLGPVYPGYRVGYEIELQRVTAELERYENFYFTGALADFSYADFQILCAKSIDLVDMIQDPGSSYNRVGRIRENIKTFNDVVTIGSQTIGKEYPPYIIGEIGLCHNGSVEIAKELIDVCAEAGCQAVKIQTYNSERVSAAVLDARHHEDILDLEENLHQLFNRLIFSFEELRDIFLYARSKNIDMFSTPFDIESLRLLEKLDVPAYKISSMDLVNIPLIREVARTMRPLIISTGMSTIGDIEEAVNTVLEVGNPNLILLHCISSYPSSASESNLRLIKTLSDTFHVITGFSDHFPDIYLSTAAVALGACVIEKHVTLDRAMKGPDHMFSLEPKALASLVKQSGDTFMALGSGVKKISASEYGTIQKLRRSIIARASIPAGTTITREMLVVKSPGIGILPKYIDLVVGRPARADIKEDHPITWDMI